MLKRNVLFVKRAVKNAILYTKVFIFIDTSFIVIGLLWNLK